MPLIDDTEILALNSTTRRRVEDRFAEVVNVRDFGAQGNSNEGGTIGADDHDAIMAAINWTAGRDRGVIFFPPGVYRVGSSLQINTSPIPTLIFRGVGQGSKIVGNFDGYLIDRPLLETSTEAQTGFEYLHFINNSSGESAGAIRWHSASGCHIRHCAFAGKKGFHSTNGLFGLSINDCEFVGQNKNTGAMTQAVGIEVYLGGPGFISGCNFIGYNKAIWLRNGCVVTGCRMESNDVGIEMYGGTMIGCGFEANNIAIRVNGNNSLIASCGCLADPFAVWPNGGARTTGNTTLGSVTITGLADMTNIVVGMSIFDHNGVIVANPANPEGFYVMAVSGSQVTMNKPAIATMTGADIEFWLLSTRGLEITGGQGNIFQSNIVGGHYSQAACYIADNNGYNVFDSCTFINGQPVVTTAPPGVMPDHPDFYVAPTALYGGRVISRNCNFQHTVAFADLPYNPYGSAPENQWRNPVKGEKHFIHDGGSEAIGATVSSGTGSTFMELMWNGSVWKRVG